VAPNLRRLQHRALRVCWASVRRVVGTESSSATNENIEQSLTTAKLWKIFS
jgi:hypothetical protein